MKNIITYFFYILILVNLASCASRQATDKHLPINQVSTREPQNEVKRKLKSGESVIICSRIVELNTNLLSKTPVAKYSSWDLGLTDVVIEHPFAVSAPTNYDDRKGGGVCVTVTKQ